jgi:hypothetical protein
MKTFVFFAVISCSSMNENAGHVATCFPATSPRKHFALVLVPGLRFGKCCDDDGDDGEVLGSDE